MSRVMERDLKVFENKMKWLEKEGIKGVFPRKFRQELPPPGRSRPPLWLKRISKSRARASKKRSRTLRFQWSWAKYRY